MKVLLIILAVTVLHGVIADSGVCLCGHFLRSTKDGRQPDYNFKMYSKFSHLVDDCDSQQSRKNCSVTCVQKTKLATGGGRLDYVKPEGDTVGELACLILGKDIQKREPAVFSKFCYGDWEFGMASIPPYICCKDGKYIPFKS